MRDPRLQQTFDVAVVMPTTLGPHLSRAVRSIFAQDLDGRVQILIGVDALDGDAAQLDALRRACPPNMALTVLDLGYSTSKQRGGVYNVVSGGALRTILSLAANSPRVAYLDDDNWWAASHLSDLLGAIDGFDWAYALRWYVDPNTSEPVCVDQWESVGPGRGVYGARFGGFVDTNTLMIDKTACHNALSAWSVPHNPQGKGVDRSVFEFLVREHSVGWTGKATAYYVYRSVDADQINKLIKTKR